MIQMPVRYPPGAECKSHRFFDIRIEDGKAHLIFKESEHHYRAIPWDYLSCMVNTLIESEKAE